MSRYGTPAGGSRLMSNSFQRAVWSAPLAIRMDASSTLLWMSTATFRYLEAFQEHSTYSSTQFTRNCIRRLRCVIECVQRGKGPEFTNQLNSSATKKQTLFEKTLTGLGIRYKPIRPYTQRHNSKVERSHCKDN